VDELLPEPFLEEPFLELSLVVLAFCSTMPIAEKLWSWPKLFMLILEPVLGCSAA
jgi:hypothetical protein